MLNSTFWIVTPCYYDTSSFVRLRAELEETLKKSNPQVKINFILIDDSAGMDDDLTRMIPNPDTRVFTPPFNLGHQRAIVFGLRKIQDEVAEKDIVITMDSDGEDRPVDLHNLLQALKNSDQHDLIVLARRTKRKVSLKFKIMYFFFTLFFRFLTGRLIMSGNFALYTGGTLKKFILHPFFDLCYSSTLVNIKIPLETVPCERGPRYFGQSRMGYFNLIVHGFRMLMPFIDRISIRAMIGTGIISACSLLTLIAVIFSKYFSHTVIPDWYLPIALITFLVSVLAMGLFLILFAMFNQVQSIILRKIDQ